MNQILQQFAIRQNLKAGKLVYINKHDHLEKHYVDSKGLHEVETLPIKKDIYEQYATRPESVVQRPRKKHRSNPFGLSDDSGNLQTDGGASELQRLYARLSRTTPQEG
jgi:hypothetical protein